MAQIMQWLHAIIWRRWSRAYQWCLAQFQTSTACWSIWCTPETAYACVKKIPVNTQPRDHTSTFWKQNLVAGMGGWDHWYDWLHLFHIILINMHSSVARKFNRWGRLWNSFAVVTALLGYLDLAIPFFWSLEMPELLLMYSVELASLISSVYASNRSNASLLAEVSAHYTKFLVRHLPHLPTW